MKVKVLKDVAKNVHHGVRAQVHPSSVVVLRQCFDYKRADWDSLTAALLAIVDSYDAMTSTRPYREGLPKARALDILNGGAGDQWDPELIEKFDFV